MDKGYTYVELLVTLGVISILIFFFLVMPFIRFSSLGEGKHTGYVTAIEQEGYIFRNYVVYFKTDNSSSQEDKYCLNRERSELANKLKEYSKNKKSVQLTYRGVRGIGLGQCEDPEIINAEKL